MTDGPVSAMEASDGVVYLGGAFSRVGPASGSSARIDASSGNPITPAALIVGVVQAIASDGSGGWYLGGQFSSVRGQPRSNLAHIDDNGNLTAWDPGASSLVRTLAFDTATGTLYVGGSFTTLGGQPRNRLGAVHGTTGVATAWNPNPVYGPAPGITVIYTLALKAGAVFVGGTFSTIGGANRNYLAALDPATGIASAWNPDGNAPVRALGVTQRTTNPFTVTVYAAGNFTSLGGQPRNYLAAIDGGTGAATGWNPGPSAFTYALALRISVSTGAATTIYAGGDFTLVGGQARNHIVAMDVAGAVTTWNPNANGTVNALAYVSSNGTVYAGGGFTSIGGQVRNHLAALDGTGVATGWDPRLANGWYPGLGQVHAIAVSGSVVHVGGDFAIVGGLVRNHLAALDIGTGLPTAWDPNANGQVGTMALSAGTLYVGGDFTSVAGQPRNRAAAFDGAGAITSWNPDADQTVLSVVPDGGTVYLGGFFGSVGGQSRSRLAAVDAVSAVPTAWNPGPDGGVDGIAANGNTVYVGGEFATVGGQARNRLAAIDRTTGAVLGWNPNPGPGSNAFVNSIAVSGTTVFVGGDFESVGGRPRDNLAALDAATGIATTWDPYTNGEVLELELIGTTLYAAGSFSAMGGQFRGGVGALDVTTGLLTPWNPKLGGTAAPIATDAGLIFVGGNFWSVDGLAHPYVAAFSEGATAVVLAALEVRPDGLSLSPNPFRRDLDLRFALPYAGATDVAIYDVGGRLVRRLQRGILPAGEQRVSWDGREDDGRTASAGVYFVRVQTATLDVSARAVRLN